MLIGMRIGNYAKIFDLYLFLDIVRNGFTIKDVSNN